MHGFETTILKVWVGWKLSEKRLRTLNTLTIFLGVAEVFSVLLIDINLETKKQQQKTPKRFSSQ